MKSGTNGINIKPDAYSLEGESINSRRASSEQLVSEDDYLELSRLLTEHVYRTDHGRADTLHELYVEGGELMLPGTPLRGRKAIFEWGKQLVANAPRRTIRHSISNMRFVYAGPYVAKGISLLTVYMDSGNETASTIPWSIGEDHDTFVRTDEGWKMASRRWVELFSRGDRVDISLEQ